MFLTTDRGKRQAKDIVLIPALWILILKNNILESMDKKSGAVSKKLTAQPNISKGSQRLPGKDDYFIIPSPSKPAIIK